MLPASCKQNGKRVCAGRPAAVAAIEAWELHDFWKSRGVRLEGQHRALVQRGAAGSLAAGHDDGTE